MLGGRPVSIFLLLLTLQAADTPSEPAPPVRFDLRAEVRRVRPKFRLRDGTRHLPGTNVFAEDLGAEESETGAAAALSGKWAGELLHLEAWVLEASGTGHLARETAWAGTTYPAGTRSDFDVEFYHLEAGYRHRFWIKEGWLRVDLGVDVEFLRVQADLGFAETTLAGFFWTPQAVLGVEPLEGVHAQLLVGGLSVATVKGATAVLEPFEVGAGLRLQGERLAVEVGWTMYHVHLEEDLGDPEEDVIHMRLRGWHAGLSLRF